uniref:SDR family NAD(P)-dependent oxidoreductase n=1 Tax=Dactylosporangium sucinum TaxID=1424081 RepID=UPI00357158D1
MMSLTPERLDAVLRVKAVAARYLHELTADHPVTAFVLFSSASGVFGAPGQANYAAGNAYLDALAAQRHALGLPATSFAWGLWEQETGMAGRLDDAQRRRIAQSGAPLTAELGLALLDAGLGAGSPLLVAARLDLPRMRTQLAGQTVPALLRGLIRGSRRDAAAGAANGPLAGRAGSLAGLTDAELLGIVRAQVAAVLGHASADAVPAGRAFNELGFDSLTAVELRNSLARVTGLSLPATLVFDYPNPGALAAYLRDRLGGVARTVTVHTAKVVDEPVAIVGMACRYPGGVLSPDDLWHLVETGGDGIAAFPTDRGWDVDRIFDATLDREYLAEGGFVPGMAEFDAGFFGISPREALAMDPQQRLLLETSWEALERAGIDPGSLRGEQAGVFAGLMYHDYVSRLPSLPDSVWGFVDTGNAGSALSGRIAYVLGLTGPAMTVDTACSSSLVALHLAVQAIRNGECGLALAGGVTVMATPGTFAGFARQGGLAGDGRCKSYAGAADGTGWAEGVGVLVLERLSDARRNGHRVWGVVRGSAVNQDGASNGLTAPNGPSQERVILQALASAGLSPSDVDVVEGHGTGTRLGDPIEAQALLATYGQDRDEPLWLGSVKSNIGHTQAAAGVAGVIKMVLAMQHATMPATLHVDEPTPQVDWTAGRVSLLTEARPWPNGRPRRAGVSSFGISGTNAHVIIEQGDPAPRPDPVEAPAAWLVSARSEAALRAQAARLADWAAESRDGLVDTAVALATQRSHFPYRAVATGATRDELILRLREITGAAPGNPGRTVLVFPGHGWQRAGLGTELLATEPVFAASIDECARALAPWVDFDLRTVLADDSWLGSVERVQPVLWALMVSLARLWESVGVTPDAVVGHSQGEVAAAVIAGVLTLDQGAQVVAVRSRALRDLTEPGAMASVAAPPAEVEGWLTGGITVAAVNGPAAVAVSGPEALVRDWVAGLAERSGREVRTRVLAVDFASHSPLVAAAAEHTGVALAGLRPAAARIPWYSTVTGSLMTGEDAGGDYWRANLREPVRFADATEALARAGYTTFVEAAGHPVLLANVVETAEHAGVDVVTTGTLRRDEPERLQLLTAAGVLHTAGVGVDWPRLLNGGAATTPVALPTYAFEHSRYWLDATGGAGDMRAAGLGDTGHPLLPAAVGVAGGQGRMLTGRLSLAAQPWLADHEVAGTVLVTGTTMLELAVRAADEVGRRAVRELTLHAPLAVPARDGVRLQVTVGEPAGDGGDREVGIYAATGDDEDWVRYASGTLTDNPGPAPGADFGAWPPAGAEPVPIDGLYERVAAAGVVYGPAFQVLRNVWRRGDDVFADVVLPGDVADRDSPFGIHPQLLDGATQALAAAGAEGADGMPFVWSDARLYATGATHLRMRVGPAAEGGVAILAVDAGGEPVVSVGSLVLRPVTAGPGRGPSLRDAMFALDWTPAATDVAAPAGPWTVVGADPHAVAKHLAAAGFTVHTGPGGAGSLVVHSPVAAETDLVTRLRAATSGALLAVQQWLGDDHDETARLLFVTSGAAIDPVAAAVWGLVRSAQSEHPGRFVLLDIDGGPVPAAAWALAADGDEPQLAVRDEQVLVPRLGRAPALPDEPADWNLAGRILVTGATGALGTVVARHLVAHGARDLLLVSRSGPAAPGAAELVEELEAAGAVVELVPCDVGDRDALAGLLTAAGADRPLAGVVHVAGVTDDGVIESQDAERLGRVLGPKAEAAWHLHELTLGLPLERFVLFGSAAGLFGGAGMANYAAANSFLDALAAQRRAAGLTGVSLAWGAWAEEGGMNGRLGVTDQRRLARAGAPLTSEEGTRLLDLAVNADLALLVPTRIDAAQLRGAVPPLLRGLAIAPARRVAGRGDAATPAGHYAALSPQERTAALAALVSGQVAAVLGFSSAASLPQDRAFTELGFDSLTAVELRNGLAGAVGLRLPATLVFDYPSVDALAGYLADRFGTGGGAPAAAKGSVTAAATDEPIAIVGMSCRFPGDVTSPGEFWNLVAGGRDGVTDLPADRGWDVSRLFNDDPDQPGTSYVRQGCFLTDVAGFDAGFFRISPREALAMDPQQRLLLETSWEALEHAGIDPLALHGEPAGVFVGTNGQDYSVLMGANPATAEGHVATSGASVMSGRVSYVLGLTGPAVTVDTACSSSLVALHWAAQALRNGECTLALVGGVSVMSTPGGFVEFSRQRGLAADGRIKAFAGAADGTAWGEGVGMLVVERLSDARRRGHRVLGIVRGSAVNQDGASNGLTAPNGPSQERVILQALANASLSPSDVDVVEGHGTGTRLGDPIEAQALLATYGQDREEPLWLGSVKSNIGHTQAAAGVAGVIKMVLAMQHQTMPPTLHVDEPSPHVDWTTGRVSLLTEPRPWPNGRPRRAGVSSFGISGTNAHVVIEEGDPAPSPQPGPLDGPTVWMVSARSQRALRAQAARLADWAAESGDGLHDTAVALAT